MPSSIYGKPISTNIKGLSTFTKIKVMNSNLWTSMVSGYDSKGLMIYSKSTNPFQDYSNTLELQLGFTGNIIESKTTHVRSGGVPITIYDYHTYDSNLRPLKHTQKVGNGNTELIVWNKYDEMGQQTQKKIGGSAASTYQTTNGLQTVDYTFNIRGWLKGINDPGSSPATTSDLFAFKINYNTPALSGSKALYNGNISETQWKSKSDNILRSYKYDYDELNRLQKASFVSSSNNNAYTEGPISYDKNGNITSLERYGMKVNNTLDKIDILSYHYFPNSNRLRKVTDTADLEGFNNGQSNNEDDYTYDAAGNMVSDNNKKIIGTQPAMFLEYNYLNLPDKINFRSNKYIQYTYDVLGTKLRKTVVNGLTSTVTDYCSGFIYENNVLQYFPHEEGYLRIETDGSYSYIYQYKDHLGNVRLSYGDSKILVYENAHGTIAAGFEPLNGGLRSTNAPLNGVTCIRVGTKNAGSGIKKELGVNVPQGTRFKISITLDRGTSDNLRIIAGNSDNNGTIDYEASIIQSGVYEFEFTTSTYYPTLRLEMDNANIATQSTKWFYIFKIKQEKAVMQVIEENNYYAFGLKHKGYNNIVTSTNPGQKIMYNGKEIQNEFDLNLYDYQARNYDPAIGRWMNIDPLAEKSRRFSPYTYALNNPIYYIDPDGMEVQSFSEEDFDVKVDLGYGQIRNKKNINGAVGFSGAAVKMNKKGQEKVTNNAKWHLENAGYKPETKIDTMDETAREGYAQQMASTTLPTKVLYSDAKLINKDGMARVEYISSMKTEKGAAMAGGFSQYSNKVYVSADSFTNNLNLFLVLIHEGMHGWDNHHGVIKAFGGDLSDYGKARAVSEVRAYQMQQWFQGGLTKFQSDMYNSYLSTANVYVKNNAYQIKSFPKFFDIISGRN